MDVSMGGVRVPCLVDTGSMVSTFTESFFLQHFEPWGQERLRSCNWLQLRAANGLAIPYIGYLELDVMLCSKLIPGCGVLVVRDPPGNVSTLVPGVLGMNIIRRCYRELFGQHGLALFNLPAVAEAPESVTQALQKCHQASAPAHRCTTGRADSIPVRAADLLSTVPATPLRRLPDTSEAAVRRTTRATAGATRQCPSSPKTSKGTCTGGLQIFLLQCLTLSLQFLDPGIDWLPGGLRCTLNEQIPTAARGCRTADRERCCFASRLLCRFTFSVCRLVASATPAVQLPL
ncbi:hypothetical protein N1851_024128 [Merluccius polli]|uniref:Uncharacterized protein n=1 Tax=Merluccius polli TaxID=89951 RepID=A0AA47NUM4_MERPO|nr:hypothetical protein N1851_024128 [Merluccius polli]